jgi:hypothetical protein
MGREMQAILAATLMSFLIFEPIVAQTHEQ